MPDQDPWELNYAPAAPPPQASTGYSVKGLTGTEPKIQLGPVSGTNTSVAELDPWEKPYQRPQTPATSLLDEGVRLAKIGATASGLKMAKDVIAGGGKAAMDFIVGNPVNPQDVQQFKSGAGTLIGGIRDEPARVWQELVKSGEAMTRGDLNAAADHLWFSVPIAGAAGQGMAEYLNRGDIKGALAHAFGSLLPVAHEPAIGAIKALPEAAETTSAAASGAAKGGWQGATGPTVLPIKIKGVQVAEIPGVPASIAGAVTGGGAGALLGGPKGSLAGAAVGAAIPAVRGAIKGGRAAVADLRTARAAAASAEEAAAAPVVNPPLQLPPGAIIPPAPADASFVRSVPAEYPPVELTPQEQALAAHILQNVEPLPPRLALPPAPPRVIVPEAPAPIPDTSFVRGVPAQYPEIVPPTLRANAPAEAAATTLRDLMQQSGTLPAETVPAAPEAPTVGATNQFEAYARVAKAQRLAKAANESGLTIQDAHDMITDEAARKSFAQGMHEDSVSPQTMALIEEELRKLQPPKRRGGRKPQ